jgi:regulator of sirC expression with transglutaminase-like and TPR domain
MTQARYCRREAYELFARQTPLIETSHGLLTAAVAMSMHELDDVTPDFVSRTLAGYADDVRRRVRSNSTEALLAHLHDVLFEEAGFVGNVEDYYNPLNSYAPAVVQSRRGLPITLSLIYKVVAERVGLDVVGVNAPLHFMAAVRDGEKRLLVDPFFGGRALSEEEALSRLEEIAGAPVPRTDDMLPVATHRQWIMRMLQNLINVFAHVGLQNETKAMLELRALLGP